MTDWIYRKYRIVRAGAAICAVLVVGGILGGAAKLAVGSLVLLGVLLAAKSVLGRTMARAHRHESLVNIGRNILPLRTRGRRRHDVALIVRKYDRSE
jgi:hypothetical protein